MLASSSRSPPVRQPAAIVPFPGRGRESCLERRSSFGELMAAAQAGDAAAYRVLLEDARRWLARYFARRLPPAIVDDAVQDALIAVHEKRRTYDPARPFEPWLAAIARYKCIDRLRAMRRSA